ncbi:MAG TPA: primosomal protein N' [Candidatus Krumholzibacteria bacterium]|nr:primosomal protein N' [Candidatus Krumholzibacteria bacterium]HPD70929.1 primosomal protein N' [Candidatus Krumholzibacteria bacterium]HRY39371.1 primosomal protein N' [Candidatus Krumholzibacteria bacterium]
MPSLLVDVVLPVPLPGAFTYRWTADLSTRRPASGDLVRAPFGRRRGLVGLVVDVREAPDGAAEVAGYPLRDLEAVLPEAYRLGADRQRLAAWLAGYYALPLGEVVPLFHPPNPGTRGRRARTKPAPYPLQDPLDVSLTAEQTAVVDAARRLLAARAFGSLLLHGVTGSGKTEVYLHVIDAALGLGRGALYLLPEIALTPQALARITVRFGDAVAALHSGLSAGERCRVHEAAAAGEIKVVVGPRSALFAPLPDLGVIVVDEEHDASYKQDEKPRYHARDVALVRGRESGAVVLLGSATPDLGTWQRAAEGRHTVYSLSGRLGGPLPAVELVDLRGEPPRDGFSERLLAAVGETLAAGRQSILYHNRRGFARQLQCRDCGAVVMCPHCDIGLVWHLRPRRLLCHYCAFQREVPATCPACGSPAFLPAGGGTEKTELALRAAFPDARLLRLDHDTTRQRGSHGRILGAFAGGEADILVGTQMVAKGHHFPGVSLVGVLAADDGLSLPDFRAGERVFQLLTQVAGRAGRNDPGRVLLQTWQPDHPVILCAAEHDFVGFARLEAAHRRVAGYPPFQRLLRLGLSGPRQRETSEAAAQLKVALARQLAGDGRTVLGPAPAVFARLQGRFREHLLVKGDLSRGEKAWVADCCRALRDAYRGLEVIVDIDPVGVW